MISKSMTASLILMGRVLTDCAEKFPEPQNYLVSAIKVWSEYADEAISHSALEPLIVQSFEYMLHERMIYIGRISQDKDGFITETGYEGVRLTPEMLSVLNAGAPDLKATPSIGQALAKAINAGQWKHANQVFCRVLTDLVVLRNRVRQG